MQFGYAKPPADEQADAIKAQVHAHALALKIGLVNAIRTDGLTDPVTADAMTAIRQRYSDIIAEVSARQLIGETITTADKQTVGLIKAGFAYFKAVDEAAAVIIASGSPANPLATDGRWPAAPSLD